MNRSQSRSGRPMRLAPRAALVGWAAGWGIVWASSVSAQQTVEVLRTGETPPLASLFRPVEIRHEIGLSFDFGFATDEVVEAEVFFDSLTVTLRAGNDFSLAAVVATLDASGAFWAPATPGTIPLVPDAIVREPFQLPDLAPLPVERRFTFQATVPLPPEFQHREVHLVLDLFDNGNSVASTAWLGSVQAVPEPGAAALALVGTAFCLARRKAAR